MESKKIKMDYVHILRHKFPSDEEYENVGVYTSITEIEIGKKNFSKRFPEMTAKDHRWDTQKVLLNGEFW